MSAWGSAVASLAVSLSVILQGAPQANTPSRLQALLSAAAAHVDRYMRGISDVVALEAYEQAQQTPFGLTSQRTRADMLVFEVGSVGWVPFRDVFEVDGRTVRDRQAKLERLFGQVDGDALAQARALYDENARFNLNAAFVDRTINTPMAALMYLQTANQARSMFKIDGMATVGDRRCAVVGFTERTTPSLIRSPHRIAVSGRFWIEEATGAIVRSELRARASLNRSGTAEVRARVTVKYVEDPQLDLWVPLSMDDLYELSPGSQTLTGRATYSDFRRFSVTTQSRPR